MSSPFSHWPGIAVAVGVAAAVWAGWSWRQPSQAHSPPPAAVAMPRPPPLLATTLHSAAAPAAPSPAERSAGAIDDRVEGALTALPPEDAAWVLDEVERTLQVRPLSPADQARLILQLASVRTHEVAARTEQLVSFTEDP